MDIQALLAQAVPRRTLLEPHFRKYELDIARACHCSVVIKPPIKAQSYIVAISDAMLGYRRFNYPSKHIPAGYDVTNIKPIRLADGSVLLRNTIQDAVEGNATTSFANKIFPASDRETITKLVDALASHTLEGHIRIRVDSQDDINFVLSFNDGTRDVSIDPEPDEHGIMRVF